MPRDGLAAVTAGAQALKAVLDRVAALEARVAELEKQVLIGDSQLKDAPPPAAEKKE